MVGVPLDEGGMRPDKVEEQLDRLSKAQRAPKFIYHQHLSNPTGFVMPPTPKQLIELGKHYGVPIIEDNCYADVHPEGPLEPAFMHSTMIKALSTCSLSKILAPGLRRGNLRKTPMLDP
ncbi:MAG: hypothetical protein CM15mP120_10690 [Pseudomonadota bacterium]|nr:MAG: hypothetical protein CM15mP120_10690 [Pseudomonadota bacterium]